MRRVWLGSEGITFLQKATILAWTMAWLSSIKIPSGLCLFGLYHSMSPRQSLLFLEVLVSMEQGTVRDILFQISLVDGCALGYRS
jgi:hypothetical protein